MLDIKYLRQNIDFVSRKMHERGQAMNLTVSSPSMPRGGISSRRLRDSEASETRSPKQIGEKKKKQGGRHRIITRMGEVSARIKELDETLKQTDEELQAIMMTLPNIPHESVVCGKDAEDNPVIRIWEKSRRSLLRHGRTGRSARA